jgi:hypothetical protein
MKKNKLLRILSLLLFAACFNDCKKYEEGGWTRLTRKHLFGGNNIGDNKTWKLKLFEVNGVDSTEIIKQNLPDNFFEVTFTLTDPKYINLSANTGIFKHGGSVGDKTLLLGYEDTTGCKNIGGTYFCSRDFLSPEYNKWSKIWDIRRLTSKEIVIETNWKLRNSYRVILTN